MEISFPNMHFFWSIGAALLLLVALICGIAFLIYIFRTTPRHESHSSQSQQRATRQVRRLYRSDHDRMLGGICGGLAEFFQLDSTLVRLGMVFLGIITGILPVIIFYIIALFIIPMEPREETHSYPAHDSDVK